MRVKVLGTLEVDGDDGQPLAVNGAKQRALLAILAVSVGRAVGADRLVDLLWGDAPPADAGNALQHQVSRLRKALGADALANRGPGYVLDLPPEDVDAVGFEDLAAHGRAQLRLGHLDQAAVALRDAADLWRGPPLHEFDGHWALAEASRLEQIRLDALEDRITADLGLGRHQDLVGELEGLVADHPYREPFWGQLMLALYRCGRQTDALAAFQRARRVLSEDQGLDPGPQLQALEAAVLRHDPELAWRPAPATATPPTQGNLPVPLTTFIGREEQLVGLRSIVAKHRLVTLTGAGGSGKTRLAVELASSLREDFCDGAWMVELAALADAAGVPQAVASTLAAGATGQLSPLADVGPPSAATDDRLTEYLRDRQLLLVLDNCEHLFPGVSEWADALLATAPGVHVLATSREPLGIVGEMQWLVPPLGVPAAEVDDPADPTDLDELAEVEAVRLFEDRARRVSDFELTAETAAPVSTICRHLDGLPLAIELAAARTKALPVAHIAAQLGDRFHLLVSTSRTTPRRQRTLRAALDWSYELLTEAERTVFGLVSVFDGGCSLEALQALAAQDGLDPHQVVELVVGLVDKSLVIAQPARAAGPRYEMLETIREYGRARLASAGRLAAGREAHRSYFAALAEEGEEGILSSEHRSWQARLEQEYANLQAAFDDAVEAGAAGDALRLAYALWWFWSLTDRRGEGRLWLETALAAATDDVDPTARMRALTALCYIAGQQLDFEPAIAAGEQALALSAERGDVWDLGWAKQSLALTLEVAGQRQRSAALRREARAIMEAAGEHWRVAANDIMASVSGVLSGDLDEVDRASEEALRQAGLAEYEPFRCWAYLLRAHVAEQRGDLDAALAESERALASARRLELNQHVAFALARFGAVSLRAGDLVTADAALHEALTVAEATRMGWFGALARVRLSELVEQQGDELGARRLLREVVDWADDADTGYGREVFFLVLGGDPVAEARARLH